MHMLLSINSQNPQMRLVKKAVECLRDGGVIIYPTDTVYGLGCDLFNKKGIEKIYDIKKRSKKDPLSFVCADLKDISRYAWCRTMPTKPCDASCRAPIPSSSKPRGWYRR